MQISKKMYCEAHVDLCCTLNKVLLTCNSYVYQIANGQIFYVYTWLSAKTQTLAVLSSGSSLYSSFPSVIIVPYKNAKSSLSG